MSVRYECPLCFQWFDIRDEWYEHVEDCAGYTEAPDREQMRSQHDNEE